MDPAKRQPKPIQAAETAASELACCCPNEVLGDALECGCPEEAELEPLLDRVELAR
ncbi:hypothetical protein AADZ90_012995 [Aestuariibius sp. 2305UL40-4]|uniref:hypothetical protein n=1 Tax=Aestuariibius violaceus TaxID=3234132 RepID=UPI00345E1C70